MKYDRVVVYQGYEIAPGDVEWQPYGEFPLRAVQLPAEFDRLSILIEDSTGANESIAIEVVR